MAYEVDLIIKTVLWTELVKVVSVLCDSMNGLAGCRRPRLAVQGPRRIPVVGIPTGRIKNLGNFGLIFCSVVGHFSIDVSTGPAVDVRVAAVEPQSRRPQPAFVARLWRARMDCLRERRVAALPCGPERVTRRSRRLRGAVYSLRGDTLGKDSRTVFS